MYIINALKIKKHKVIIIFIEKLKKIYAIYHNI